MADQKKKNNSKNLRILAIEDEVDAQNLLKRYIIATEGLKLHAMAGTFEEAQDFIRKGGYDVILMDIQLRSKSSLDLLSELSESGPPLILTTASSQYALKAYDFGAADYLLKPFDMTRFQKAMGRAGKMLQINQGPKRKMKDYILIYSEKHYISIKVSDIIYISVDKKSCQLHLLKNRTIVWNKTLQYVVEQIASDEIIRIHRSTAINLRFCASMEYYHSGSYSLHLREVNTPLIVSPNYVILLKKLLSIK